MAVEKDDAVARFAASVVGSVIAESFTLPTDVAKTRLQVQLAGGSGEFEARKLLNVVH